MLIFWHKYLYVRFIVMLFILSLEQRVQIFKLSKLFFVSEAGQGQVLGMNE